MVLTEIPKNCPLCQLPLVEKDIGDFCHRLCCDDGDHNVWGYYSIWKKTEIPPNHLNIQYKNYQISYRFNANRIDIYPDSDHLIDGIEVGIWFVPCSREDFVKKVKTIILFG